MMYVGFDLGETRHIRIQIHSCKNEPFEILSASYSLTEKGKTDPEDNGASVIQDHVIDQVIAPKKHGLYNLKITYHIADETLVENVEVRVN